MLRKKELRSVSTKSLDIILLPCVHFPFLFRVPEAVLQAMNCRPIIGPEQPAKRQCLAETEVDEEAKQMHTSPTRPVVPGHLTSFLPRALACRRILFKEMSLQLGPLQGCSAKPSATLPTPRNSLQSEQKKRVVFHPQRRNPTDFG